MDDLVRDATLKGPDLVRTVRALLGPSASIDQILDETRTVNLRRHALELAAHNFENVFELFDRIPALNLAEEDLDHLFEMIATNRDGEFSVEISKHAGILVDSGMLRLALKAFRPPPPPEPPSCWCFIWAIQRRKKTSHHCSSQTSPGTGK